MNLPYDDLAETINSAKDLARLGLPYAHAIAPRCNAICLTKPKPITENKRQ